jgi:hypothetical protein
LTVDALRRWKMYFLLNVRLITEYPALKIAQEVGPLTDGPS